MKYKEWDELNIIEDKKNPFSTLFEYSSGERFYIEPVFYTKFKAMLDHHPEKRTDIIEEMKRIVLKNKRVVFTGSFDFPRTSAPDYIFLELEDITNLLKIFVEDKSRGSDYGD